MKRLSRRAVAVLRATRRFNRRLPASDPQHQTHKMIGFVVPNEIAGVCEALFALQEIQVAGLEVAGLLRVR